MNIIGLDAGFAAANRKTSGLAQLVSGKLRVHHTTCNWKDRKDLLAEESLSDVTAIDAPLLPELTAAKRKCERVFTLGKFQRRFKPGLSHIAGTGMCLRKAGFESAHQFLQVTTGQALGAGFPRVMPNHNVVEAFPNAFLGVMLDEKCYEDIPCLKRGQKFDWLYDECRKRGAFHRVVSVLDLGCNRMFLDTLDSTTNHEERAALVCLLTAASVAMGRYTAVGEHIGGFFFLPSLDLWTNWSRKEMDKQCRRENGLETWIDGKKSGTTSADTEGITRR